MTFLAFPKTEEVGDSYKMEGILGLSKYY